MDEPPPASPDSPAEVMRRFESLGDTCEFGFVQRHHGIEPISLLRWAGAPLPGLLLALRARFAGLYRREDLMAIDGGSVVDMKYDLRFHAGPHAHENDGTGRRAIRWTEAALAAHAREARHVGFLLRTTLETLASRARVFVYKTNAGLAEAEILRLKCALDLYGPQRLLCVRPAAPDAPPGEARLLAPGLKLGTLPRLAPYECQDDVDAPAWLALCRSALLSPWEDEAAEAAAARDAAPPSVADAPPAFALTPEGVMLLNPALAAGALTALYHTLLMRPPDGGGLHALAGTLSRGETGLEDIIASMLSSEEFAALAPRFLRRYVREG